MVLALNSYSIMIGLFVAFMISSTLIADMSDPFNTLFNTRLTVKSNRRMECILEAVASV